MELKDFYENNLKIFNKVSSTYLNYENNDKKIPNIDLKLYSKNYSKNIIEKFKYDEDILKTLTYEEKINFVKNFNNEEQKNNFYNDLIKKNIRNIRNECINIGINLKNFKHDSDEILKNTIYKDIYLDSKNERSTPIFRNMLRKIELYNNDIDHEGFYLYVDVYNSINNKKFQTLIVNDQNTVLDLCNSINCIINYFEKKNYNSFFYFENLLIVKDIENISIEIEEIQDNYKKNFNKILNIKSMKEMKIKDLIINFDKPYIFRDQNSCDHMISFIEIRLKGKNFKNIDYNIRKFPLQIFEGDTIKKVCQICEFKFSKITIKDSKLSSKTLLFLCNDCYSILNLNPDNTLKNKNLEIYEYNYEYN